MSVAKGWARIRRFGSGRDARAAVAGDDARGAAGGRRTTGRKVSLTAVLATAAVALAACSQAVAGQATAAKDLTVGVPQKVGPDAPTPSPSPTESGPLPSFGESVTIIESRRLAYATPRPDVVDPSYTKGCLPTLPLKSVDALGGFGGLFVDTSVEVFRQNGFVAGYVQCRQSSDSTRDTVAAAIEMRDEASAKAVATALIPTLAKKGDQVVPLTGMADARAVTSVSKKNKKTDHIIQTVVPFGRLVLYQYSEDTDLKKLDTTVVKTVQSALQRAHDYIPTPLAGMNSLRDDPRNLRPLLADPNGATFVQGGGYSLDAYYGQAEDPDAERTLLKANGFQAMYQNLGEKEAYGIYELRDPGAAANVVSGFATIEKKVHPDLKQITVPEAGAGSFCVAFLVDGLTDEPVQRCFFTATKYVYQVDVFGFSGSDLTNPKHVGALVTKQKAKAPKK